MLTEARSPATEMKLNLSQTVPTLCHSCQPPRTELGSPIPTELAHPKFPHHPPLSPSRITFFIVQGPRAPRLAYVRAEGIAHAYLQIPSYLVPGTSRHNQASSPPTRTSRRPDSP